MSSLRRDIGFIGAAAIALNGIVGAGIFAMPQALVEGVGPASPYLILVFGALMIFPVLVFGELAAHFDQAGGPVVYTNAAFGRIPAFFVGWLYYLARAAAFAANINVLLAYTATFVPGLDKGFARLVGIGAVIAVVTAINIVGVKTAIRTLNIVTILKVAPLIAFVVWGLWAFAGAIPTPQLPAAPGNIGAITLLLLYAFVGFESATATAGETSETKRNLPRALMTTMIAMAALYFLIQLAYVSVMQGQKPEGAPLAAAAQVLAGPWGAAAIAAVATASIAGNSFGSFLSTPRITFAMAEEGSLPGWFGAVHRRFATPANSILALGVFATILAMSSAFVWLAIIASLTRMLVYLVCTGALLRVRAQAPKTARPFGAFLVRAITPFIAAAFCVFAIAQAEEDAWMFLGAFAAVGAFIYAISRWTRRGEAQNG